MNNLKQLIENTIREVLNGKLSSQNYYIAVIEFLGNKVIFEPKKI